MRDFAICQQCECFVEGDHGWMRCRFDRAKAKGESMYTARLVPERCIYITEHIIETQDDQSFGADWQAVNWRDK